MSTKTVQDIVDAGFALSRASRPELMLSQAPALIGAVRRSQIAMFQLAARINPLRFAASVDVTFTGGWLLPPDLESLIRVEGLLGGTIPNGLAGLEILVVPIDDRRSFAGSPSVYQLGARVLGSGNANDPSDGTIRMIYSRRPAAVTAMSSTLDVDWPDEFSPIFEYEVAAFNARADGGRDAELDLMLAERDQYITLYQAWLEHGVGNESARYIADNATMVTHRKAPATPSKQN